MKNLLKNKIRKLLQKTKKGNRKIFQMEQDKLFKILNLKMK
jgi:hypothetical protein